MPVDARRFVRKMRGGAQAHLLEASDSHWYVVKFLNNPQHRRILVNEWAASVFLRYLGISTPETAMVRISEEFLDQTPDVYLQLGRERRPPFAGWHFGSRFPGDPARTVVYDFLPDVLLENVENLADFRGILAFDKWVGNADARQSVFFRARIAGHGPAESQPRLGFAAQMVDNGYVFEGPHWRLTDSPLQGLYFRPLVYRSVRGLEDFEPWLERIRHFPEEVVDQALKQVPDAWLDGDREEFERLMDRLLRRRKRLPELIEACRTGRTDPFPAWGRR
jgi:HipA-like kinase